MEIASNFIHEIIDKDIESGLVHADEIHTRFPPEPNGYLHIGSAKAIFINWSIAKKYGGKFNLRYDDTNPVREDDEYVKSIYEDLTWLIGEEPSGGVFYGSDYFDTCYECAVQLIRDGKAYVCDLNAEDMRKYRGTLTEVGTDSPYRNRSVEENLSLFEDMKNGKFEEGTRTLRAKIDMSSPNMNLRDPAIYRIVYAHHHRQGDKWCIYPLYDFAHSIEDAIEKITHSLCSIEFENHRPLYDWVIQNVEIYPSNQYEFARLNVTNTVMSKRYLRELVETKAVEGWDDPRMPTLSGLRRRGYTPSSILDFVMRAGVAKATSLVDIRLLEHCIREELNNTALRRIAVLDPVRVVITNYPEDKEETFEISNNPQDATQGKRAVPFSRELYIEREDFAIIPPPKFQRLKPDGEVRLMGSYIIKCNEVITDDDGNVTEIRCTADIETSNGMPADGRKVKGTIHWVSAKHAVASDVYLYENLFTLENTSDVPDDMDYKDFLNPNSLTKISAVLEPSVNDVEVGTRMQFVRMGYFVKENDNRYNRIVTLKDSFAKTLK